MARTPDPIEAYVGFLAQAERSPLTVKNYRGDLAAFAAWFEEVNGETMAPAKVNPDRPEAVQTLAGRATEAQTQQCQPQSRHPEELSDLGRRGEDRTGLPIPAQGRSWGGPQPIPQERPGPR